MLLGRPGRRAGFKGSRGRQTRKSPGKRPAGGQRTCCWAAKGAGQSLRAAEGAGRRLRPAYIVPNVAFWNQKKISRKAPGRWPKDMLLGRQRRRAGFKGSRGRRETFKASLLPNVAFWNQKKISRKAPGRWPKNTLLGRQGRREGFKGSRGRRETFKASL